MAEIKNKEKCRFHFVQDLGAGRLTNTNARIIEAGRDVYCIYPSLGSVGGEDQMIEALCNLEDEVDKAKSVGRVWARLDDAQKRFADGAISGARNIATWREFLGRNAGFGAETHGDYLKLEKIATHKRIDLARSTFKFYDPPVNPLKIDNARIVVGGRNFYCIYPSWAKIAGEGTLGRALLGVDSLVRNPSTARSYGELTEPQQKILRSVVKKVRTLITWEQYLNKPSGMGRKTNRDVMTDVYHESDPI